jgi:hypothetical protein
LIIADGPCEFADPAEKMRRENKSLFAQRDEPVIRISRKTLVLAAATEPGPFSEGTIRMGRYRGVRTGGGRLMIAMAGERLRLDGFHGDQRSLHGL